MALTSLSRNSELTASPASLVPCGMKVSELLQVQGSVCERVNSTWRVRSPLECQGFAEEGPVAMGECSKIDWERTEIRMSAGMSLRRKINFYPSETKDEGRTPYRRIIWFQDTRKNMIEGQWNELLFTRCQHRTKTDECPLLADGLLTSVKDCLPAQTLPTEVKSTPGRRRCIKKKQSQVSPFQHEVVEISAEFHWIYKCVSRLVFPHEAESGLRTRNKIEKTIFLKLHFICLY